MAGTFFAPVFHPELPDESRQAGMLTCLAICSFGCVASTVFRFLVKWKYAVKIRTDDCVILLSTVINTIANVFQLVAILNGFGRHTQYLSVPDCTIANKYAMIIIPLGVIGNLASKISIGFLILSLIKGTHKKLYRATAATMIITLILGLLCNILWATQTAPMPLSKIWDPTLPGPPPDVWKFLGILYAIGAFNICTDLLYSLSPLYFLRNVRSIGKRNKLFIQILVGSGLLVTVVAIVSLYYAHAFLYLVDMTWILVPRYICDMLERNLGVIVANAPMIKTMWTKHRASNYASENSLSKSTYGHRSNRGEGTISTMTDAERGPSTWYAKDAVREPATFGVEIVGGQSPTPPFMLPLEGHTQRGLMIMRSVDITVEGAGEWSSISDYGDVVDRRQSSRPHFSISAMSNSSSGRPAGLSRTQSSTSLSSTRTGRYSLFPPTPTSAPPPDALIPRLM